MSTAGRRVQWQCGNCILAGIAIPVDGNELRQDWPFLPPQSTPALAEGRRRRHGPRPRTIMLTNQSTQSKTRKMILAPLLLGFAGAAVPPLCSVGFRPTAGVGRSGKHPKVWLTISTRSLMHLRTSPRLCGTQTAARPLSVALALEQQQQCR